MVKPYFWSPDYMKTVHSGAQQIVVERHVFCCFLAFSPPCYLSAVRGDHHFRPLVWLSCPHFRPIIDQNKEDTCVIPMVVDVGSFGRVANLRVFFFCD